MKSVAVRLPATLQRGLDWLRRKEGTDQADTLRRLVRKGLERELAERYARGEITLREMADLLETPLRDTLELLWQMGIQGNITAAQAGETITIARDLSTRPRSPDA